MQAALVLKEENGYEQEVCLPAESELLRNKLDVKEREEKKKLFGQFVEESASMKTGEEKWSELNRWASDVRDEKLRLPTDKDYDPSTLYIPPEAFKQLSPFQKQFWELKRKHYGNYNYSCTC